MMISMFAGVAAVVGLVQPPVEAVKPAQPPVAKPADKPPAKPQTVDEQIQRAFEYHPDLRIAQIQKDLAYWKWVQERLRIAQRITVANAAREAALAARNKAQELLSMAEKTVVSRSEIITLSDKVDQAKEKLALADAELEAAVGGPPRDSDNQPIPPGGPPKLQPGPTTAAPLTTLRTETVTVYKPLATPVSLAAPLAPPTGFQADFARMLETQIKPQVKKGTVQQLLTELLAKAAAAVGRPVPIVGGGADEPADPANVFALNGDTDTLGGWLQQLTDTVSLPHASSGGLLAAPPRFNLYVREYGLLPAWSTSAPAGAVTVADFWRRARLEKAAEAKPAPAKAP